MYILVALLYFYLFIFIIIFILFLFFHFCVIYVQYLISLYPSYYIRMCDCAYVHVSFVETNHISLTFVQLSKHKKDNIYI